LGDHGAKRAVLRVLSLMPDPLRLADVAALGCRSAAPTVFEAICCHNPYPTRHLPDLHFFPMLLKATFWAIPLDRVVELSTRLSPELGQMALQQAMA
jgi:hypothetical protein